MSNSRYLFTVTTLLLVGAVVLGSPPAASAGPGVFVEFSASTATNGGAATYSGSYVLDGNGNALPFSLEVFTSGSECIRIDVTSQGTDLEATLVCPNGTIWQNDDRTAAILRPLIKARTLTRGWCTLLLSAYDGVGASADFSFRYGRYANTNSNCSSPTTPKAQAAAAPKTKVGEDVAPGSGGRGPSSH